MPTRRVSSTVDVNILSKARQISGASQAETIRQALAHFAATAGVGGRSAPAATRRRSGAPAAGASAAKAVTDMSDAEESACLRVLMQSRTALGDALVYLNGEEAVADTATKKQLRIVIGDFEADLAKVNARITAFLAEHLTMVPPSAATVDSISQLAEQVGQLTLEARRADQVISAVKSVVEIWTGTQV